ncbi:MAG: NAD-dependent epimerase/dehydratase family protein [Actinobacteria bacterium]|uniref:Unannotated protein n=1 Tax=freshwater metagenome TaxID=449393 RepID=A0A6J5ZZG3_9ZZZZ|nr:NAD-dependent epimerase/dehydratase family protein [Actinomycetota bacterium]
MALLVSPPFGASLAGSRLLVTGSNGLLGSWFTRRALLLGADVTVLRLEPQSNSALVLEGVESECRVVEGNLLDGELITATVADNEVDTIVHLAAQAIVGTANQSPRGTFEANVTGTWNVLEAARLADVPRVVVASSDKAYGESEVLPYVETMPLQASHPYDASKAAADIISRSYWATYGMPVAVTRLANIYGGGDRNLSRLIPETVAAILSGRAPVIRSDGSPERDFLFVDDAVDAYLAILDLLAAGAGGGEAFNAGSGIPRRALDVVSSLCAVADFDGEPEVLGEGDLKGEIDRQWNDSTKLRSATGWTALTQFEQGLAATLQWYREHPQSLAG